MLSQYSGPASIAQARRVDKLQLQHACRLLGMGWDAIVGGVDALLPFVVIYVSDTRSFFGVGGVFCVSRRVGGEGRGGARVSILGIWRCCCGVWEGRWGKGGEEKVKRGSHVSKRGRESL